MPKVRLTLEEQRRAETERQHRIEDDVLTGTLRRARKAAGYEYENFVMLYDAYKALKGNSFIDKIYAEVKTWKILT